MMLRRAWPRTETPFGDDQSPRSSGPLWAMPETMASTAAPVMRAVQFSSPAMPHMAVAPDKTGKQWSRESPPAIVDSFHAAVRYRQPGNDDRHHDPDGQFHRQIEGRRSMSRRGQKNS